MPDGAGGPLDEALEIVHRTGPEFGPGLSNHAPMAAEALAVLGRGERAVGWVERYRTRLDEPPRGLSPISADGWREALGEVSRAADWTAFFERELREAPWQAVIGAWVPRLAPGLMAGATHGPIRTAHAVRALAAAETEPRLRELAHGLGYWAARYQVLPGAPSADGAALPPAEALARVPRLHEPGFQFAGLIFESVAKLDEEPSFEPVIGLSGPGDDVGAYLSQLTEVCAGLYLADRGAPIAFIHTVTAPSALRHFAPYLRDADARLAARYAWQACAAIYSWYMLEEPEFGPVETPDAGREELIERAVANGDEHAIKFTEACLREYELNPAPVYLAAAADVSERLAAD